MTIDGTVSEKEKLIPRIAIASRAKPNRTTARPPIRAEICGVPPEIKKVPMARARIKTPVRNAE